MNTNTDAHPIEVGLALAWITAEAVLALAVALAALVLTLAAPLRSFHSPAPCRRAQELPAPPATCDDIPDLEDGPQGPLSPCPVVARPAGSAPAQAVLPELEGLRVAELRRLARERLGSAARVGGRRIAQARRAKLVAALQAD